MLSPPSALFRSSSNLVARGAVLLFVGRFLLSALFASFLAVSFPLFSKLPLQLIFLSFLCGFVRV